MAAQEVMPPSAASSGPRRRPAAASNTGAALPTSFRGGGVDPAPTPQQLQQRPDWHQHQQQLQQRPDWHQHQQRQERRPDWRALTTSLRAQWAAVSEMLRHEATQPRDAPPARGHGDLGLRASDMGRVLSRIRQVLQECAGGGPEAALFAELLGVDEETPPVDHLFPLLAALALAPMPSSETQTIAADALRLLVATMLRPSDANAADETVLSLSRRRTAAAPTAATASAQRVAGGGGGISAAMRCAKLLEHHNVLQGIAVAIEAAPSPAVAVTLSEILLVAVWRLQDTRQLLLYSDTVGDYVQLLRSAAVELCLPACARERALDADRPNQTSHAAGGENGGEFAAGRQVSDPTRSSDLLLHNLMCTFQCLAGMAAAEDAAMILVAHSLHEVLASLVAAASEAASASSVAPPLSGATGTHDATAGATPSSPVPPLVLGTALHVLAKLVRNCYAAFDFDDEAVQRTMARHAAVLLNSRWSEALEGAAHLTSALCVRCAQIPAPAALRDPASFVAPFFHDFVTQAEAHLALIAAAAAPASRVGAAAAHALRLLALHCPHQLQLARKIFADARAIHVICTTLIDECGGVGGVGEGTAAAGDPADEDDADTGRRILRAELAVATALLLAQSAQSRASLVRHLRRALSPASLRLLREALIDRGLGELHVSVFKSFSLVDDHGVDLLGWMRQRIGTASALRKGPDSARHPPRAAGAPPNYRPAVAALLDEQPRWDDAPTVAPRYRQHADAAGAWQGAEMTVELLRAVAELVTEGAKDAEGAAAHAPRGGRSAAAPPVSAANAAVTRRLQSGELLDHALFLIIALAHHAPQPIAAATTSSAQPPLRTAAVVPRRAATNAQPTSLTTRRGAGRSAPVEKEANPYKRRTPLDVQAATRRWSVKDLERTDVFLLILPLADLIREEEEEKGKETEKGAATATGGDRRAPSRSSSVSKVSPPRKEPSASSMAEITHVALRGALEGLQQHMEHINTQLQLCPISKHRRRVVLLDLWANVYPQLFVMLEELAAVVDADKVGAARAAERAQLLLQMLRDRGEEMIDSGNVRELHNALCRVLGS